MLAKYKTQYVALLEYIIFTPNQSVFLLMAWFLVGKQDIPISVFDLTRSGMKPTLICNGDKDPSFKIIISNMSWLDIVSNCIITKVNAWYSITGKTKHLTISLL